MSAEIGVGVIGFGLAGRVFHAPFVSAVPGLRLHGIVQRAGDEAAQAYPVATTFRDIEALLADPEIKLVVIATPNQTHFALAQQALAAGKHVVIDKPFAATSTEAAQLIELAASNRRVLAPFHNRRWDGDFLTVRKLVEAGTLGRLVTFESHFDRFRPIPREGTWKEAGNLANGLLFDLGPHLVDQCVALFGMPCTVTASVRNNRTGSAIEDAFDICLGYQQADGSHLNAWCRSSMIACDHAPRFLLHGTGGSFKKHGVDPQEPAIVAGAHVPPIDSPEPWLLEDEASWGTLTLAPRPSHPASLLRQQIPTEACDYRPFYTNVRDAILGKSDLAVPPEAGFAAIYLLELARQSSAEGRTLRL